MRAISQHSGRVSPLCIFLKVQRWQLFGDFIGLGVSVFEEVFCFDLGGRSQMAIPFEGFQKTLFPKMPPELSLDTSSPFFLDVSRISPGHFQGSPLSPPGHSPDAPFAKYLGELQSVS